MLCNSPPPRGPPPCSRTLVYKTELGLVEKVYFQQSRIPTKAIFFHFKTKTFAGDALLCLIILIQFQTSGQNFFQRHVYNFSLKFFYFFQSKKVFAYFKLSRENEFLTKKNQISCVLCILDSALQQRWLCGFRSFFWHQNSGEYPRFACVSLREVNKRLVHLEIGKVLHVVVAQNYVNSLYI